MAVLWSQAFLAQTVEVYDAKNLSRESEPIFLLFINGNSFKVQSRSWSPIKKGRFGPAVHCWFKPLFQSLTNVKFSNNKNKSLWIFWYLTWAQSFSSSRFISRSSAASFSFLEQFTRYHRRNFALNRGTGSFICRIIIITKKKVWWGWSPLSLVWGYIKIFNLKPDDVPVMRA